jgi:ERCC4-type nuclease
MSTNITVVVTSNERKLVDFLTKSIPPPFEWVQENLAVGDCLLRGPDDKIHCVVERKTVSDLWASFRDGRYEDQKRRLQDLKPIVQDVVYIIEGLLQKESESRVRSIRACLHSLQARSGFIVHRSRDVNETVQVLASLAKFYEKPTTASDSVVPTPLAVKQLKQKPSDLMDETSWAVNALALVPQMSVNKAKALLDHFKSLENLMACLKKEEDGIINVSEVQVGGRRLGKSVAQRLQKYLAG